MCNSFRIAAATTCFRFFPRRLSRSPSALIAAFQRRATIAGINSARLRLALPTLESRARPRTEVPDIDLKMCSRLVLMVGENRRIVT